MITRAGFLTAAAVVAAAAPAAAQSQQALPPFQFDLDRFNTILSKPARHRQCFGSTERSGGAVFWHMNNSIQAYTGVMKEPPDSMHAVAVLYGGAVALGFDDALWNEIIIPQLPKDSDEGSVKPGSGNPYKEVIAALIGHGSEFFVCNNAFSGAVGNAAKTLKRSPADTYKYMSGHLIQNAMLVPAGVMALNAVQEAHFTYVAS